MSGYRISGLPLADFEHLFGLSDEALAEHGAIRMRAESKPGYPCRITLEDADPGEEMILLNYAHQSAETPYQSAHAIFVRDGAKAEAVFDNEVPPLLARRLLSVRAFDADGMMTDADCVDGAELEPLIVRMLDDARTDYLHIHNAKRGCFAARVDRLA
jgi:hypothetical protein